MSGWVAATLVAALVQTARFLIQRHLKRTTLSTAGATFSRFVFSAPVMVAIVLVWALAGPVPLPAVRAEVWAFVLPGGVAQILATACVIALFTLRAFAVGIAFTKTETIPTAIAGLILLGEAISAGGALAIAVGIVAVLVLSGRPGAHRAGRAVALGWGRGRSSPCRRCAIAARR